MLVALSILFAALVGGVAFMLLDGWQRNRVQPAAAAAAARPVETAAPTWLPETHVPASSWSRPAEPETQPLPAWEPQPRRESSPLWTPPPARDDGHRDDDSRRREDEDDDSPPGLWSGWARR